MTVPRLPGISAVRRISGLKRNIASSYAARILNAVVGFLLFPFIAVHVGLENYGIWLLVSSVGLIFIGLDLGLGSSIVRYVAEAGASGSPQELRRTVNSSFALYAAFGVVAAAFFAVTMYLCWPALDIPASKQGDSVVMIALVCIGLLLVGIPLSASRQMLSGVQRLDVANLILIGQLVVRVVAVSIAILLDGGIVAIAGIEVGVVIGGSAVALVSLRVLTPSLRFDLRTADRALMKTMVGFSLRVFVLGAAAIVILQTDNLIIGAFLGSAAVTLYAGAFRFYQFCREISGVVMNAMIPEAAHAATLGDGGRLRHVLLRGTALANATVLVMVVPVAIFARPLLTQWGGGDFGSMTEELQVLLASLVVNTNHLVALGILVGMGTVGRYAVYHVIWAVGNVVLSIILIGPLDLLGVALGTAIPIVLLEPLYIRYATTTIGVRLSTFVGRTIVPSAAAAIAAGLPLLLAYRALDLDSLFEMIAASAVFAILYAACLWQIDARWGRGVLAGRAATDAA